MSDILFPAIKYYCVTLKHIFDRYGMYLVKTHFIVNLGKAGHNFLTFIISSSIVLPTYLGSDN